jgi:hypothetical protein
MNVAYWQRWFSWAQNTALGLAKKGDLLGLTAFLAELGTTLTHLINPFESLALCFRGNIFQIAGKVYAWAVTNRDPLADFRHAAEAMRAKWTAVSAPTPAGG